MSAQQKIGFIGVGLMGHGMAKNIVEKGYPLMVMAHKNKKPVKDLVKRGATEAKSPQQMAEACDVIFICVTSSLQVEDLIRRADGIKAGAHKGLIVVDCSTSDPNSTLALAAELKSSEQAAALCDGKIDATIWAAGLPNGSSQEATSTCDVVIVTLDGEGIDKLLA